MKKKWRLDPKDVVRSMGQMGASTLTASRPFNRANQSRTYEPILYHQPTGIEVSKLLGPAQHSKKKWNQLVETTYVELFPELEKRVARHLKIAGY